MQVSCQYSKFAFSRSLRFDADPFSVFSDALDFFNGGFELGELKVVEGIDRKDGIEAVDGIWQLGAVCSREKWPRFLFRMGDPIGRNVEPGYLDAGHGASELIQQEGLAAADVQNLVASLELVALGDVLRDGQPPSVVFVPAISVLARAVPIFLAPALGDDGAFRLVVLDHSGDIVAFGRALVLCEKVDLLPHWKSRCRV